MTIVEALDIKPREVMSLVGGGGKTTIMFTLARELSLYHKCIVTTTTTHIFEPSPEETRLLLVENNEDKLMKLLSFVSNQKIHYHVCQESFLPFLMGSTDLQLGLTDHK